MGMRKTVIVALMAMAWAGAPILNGVSLAQPAPGAMATEAMASSLSHSDKAALMKKLSTAKKRFTFQRKHSSQYPNAQGAYDAKIKQIDGLMAKLKGGEDFPMSDVDNALAKPETAEH
ncbi:MAG: hypothetical protein ACREQH_02085 [Candidatus Binatus sp.]